MLLKHEKTLDPPGDMFRKKKFKESATACLIWLSHSTVYELPVLECDKNERSTKT